MRPFSRWIAVLCVLLIVASAIAFVAHDHSDDANGTESAKCSVCVAAHSASPAGLAPALDTTLLSVSTIRMAPVVAAKQRLIAFALAVRPPPES
jgi:hypothetical protein